MSVKINALDHLVINVADVTRSAQWYQKVLGMEIKVTEPGPTDQQALLSSAWVNLGMLAKPVGLAAGECLGEAE